MAARDWTVLTPLASEAALEAIKNDAAAAWKTVMECRLAEVEAKKDYRKAKTRALLGGDCPRVGRDGVTVAHRDAWVDQETEDELYAYEAAKASTENAVDYLRTVRDQGSYIQSQHGSVKQAYQMVMSGAVEQ